MSRYQIRLLNGARAAARRRGAQVVGFQGSFLRRTAAEHTVFDGSFVFDLAGPQAVDGLIPVTTVLATTVGVDALERLCEVTGLPTVSIGELANVPSVALESSANVRELVRHLVRDHGRKRIGFIRGNAANPESVQRERALTDTLAELGLPIDDELFVQGNFLEASGRSAIRTLLDERKLAVRDIDALVAANDQMATGAALELLRRGALVPEEIALIGFDDDDHARSANPPLTTVAQPIELLGERAVDLLMDRLEGKEVELVTRLPAKTIFRRSCGCDWPRGAGKLKGCASARENVGASLRALCEEHAGSLAGPDGLVLDALVRAVAAPDDVTASAALSHFERELFTSTSAGGNPLRWEDPVIAIGADLSRAASYDDAARTSAARLMEIRLILNETAARNHLLGRLHGVQQANAIRVLGSALALAKDLRALARVLESTVGGLGIRHCDVCLFLPGGEPRAVKLVSHFTSASESGDLPYDTGELWNSLPRTLPPSQKPRDSIIFPAANLVHEGSGIQTFDGDLLVYPLVFAEEALGYIVYDLPASLELAWALETVAGHVSSAVSALAKKQELRRSRESAERASAAKSEFVAVMSHELRTPLNAILGHLDLCLRTALTSEQRKHTSRAHKAARALLDIVNDVLDFSKIEAEKLELEQATFELDAVLAQVRDTCALAASRKGLEFVFDVAPAVPQQLIGDSLRLTQVLVNLAGNAIKFSQRGYVLVRIECVEVEAAMGTRLGFSVEDTGIGLSEAQREALFNAFTQADSSMSRRYGGTGLGLSICKRLVALMGGSLEVKSELGQGSCFSFIVPFTEVKARTVLPSLGLGRRALVLEDCAPQAHALIRILESAGYTVDHASSLAETKRMLQDAERRGEQFDLLFSDSGSIDAAGENELGLRASDGGGPKLALVLCCEAQDPRLEARHDARPGSFLVKPYDPSAVLATLKELTTEEPPLGVPPTPHLPLASLAGRRILVAHDSEFARELAQELLNAAGAHVTLAFQGREAVESASANDFDAILMDLYMPELDGSEAAREIQALPRHARTPILAITASTNAADLERCRAAGMKPCPPPASPEAFLWTVANAVTRRSSVPARGIPSPSQAPLSAPRDSAHDNVLELDATLARLDGDLNMYRRLLKRFSSSHEHICNDIVAARRAGDNRRALLLVHTLVGSAASIGARHLTRVARTLEAALKSGEAELADTLMTDLEHSLRDTFSAVDHALANARQRAPSGTLPAVAVRPLLERLRNMVDAHDTAAVETFELLRTLCVGRYRLGERLLSLESLISSYDFESAKAELGLFSVELESMESESSHGT